MKFLLDESAELRLTQTLKQLGFDVKSISKDFQGSIADSEVFEIALVENRILITNDHDFLALISSQKVHSGVILFSLKRDSFQEKSNWLTFITQNHLEDLINKKFFIISRQGIKII